MDYSEERSDEESVVLRSVATKDLYVERKEIGMTGGRNYRSSRLILWCSIFL
jgi:hypothetical protein